MGSKSQWEIRLLKESYGDKEAILDGPDGDTDFLRQHTDSNSTGLIEITEPPRGEKVVRDVRDMKPAYPNFFEDIRLGKHHYYFSDHHETTPRYVEHVKKMAVSTHSFRALSRGTRFDPEHLDAEETASLVRELLHFIKNERSPEGLAVIRAWFESPASAHHPHLMGLFLKEAAPWNKTFTQTAREMARLPHWQGHCRDLLPKLLGH